MLFIFNELRTATAAVTSDRLGEILLREGLITQDQLKKALLEQKNTGMRLGYTLVKLGFVEETEISKMLARQYRMPAVDLSRFEVDPKILKLLPPDIAIKHTVLPLKREGRTLTVAIADPNNVTAIEDIKFITRCDVFPVIAGEYTLRNAIEKYYQQSDAQLQTLLKDIEAADDLEVVEEQQDEDVKAQDLADDAPEVKLINGLLTDAVKRGASDIHIESIGQDDDTVFRPVAHQSDRREHHDRRRPGRVQPARHQPGAGPQRRGDDVRGRAQGVSAAGPEHHHGGRDPRSRDRVDCDQGRADRPPGAVHAAHERRALHRDAHGGHGHRAGQRGERGGPDRGPAVGRTHLMLGQAW